VIGASAIEDDYGFESLAVGIDDSAHTAKISLSLLTDVGDKQDCALGADLRLVHGARDGDKRRKSRAVIGNARSKQPATVTADSNVGPRGENGVEVGRQHHNFFFVQTGQFSDHIAGGIHLRIQAGVGEKCFDRCRAQTLLKGGRGNFREVGLPLVDPIKMRSKPSKGSAHLRVFS
jgi:hypothetical protein